MLFVFSQMSNVGKQSFAFVKIKAGTGEPWKAG